jgi:hypothetical protein
MRRLAFACVLLVGCPKAAPPPKPAKTAQMAELGKLMKDQINPAFSKLSFLVFHGEDMVEDPVALKTELRSLAAGLRKSIGRLLVWKHPPTESNEGRDVFFTYASSIDKMTGQLESAIAGDDVQSAARTLEQIAKTCNNCHHFFRLEIKDSVVGPNVISQLP